MQHPLRAHRGSVRVTCGLALTLGPGALPATGQVPAEWDIELVARSSLNPAIAAFRLPNPSSISSQPVSLDESGGVAFRAILDAAEGIFYGTTAAGGVVVQAPAPVDSVFSGSLDVRNGRIAVPDAVFGAGGITVYDTAGTQLERFNPGGPLALAPSTFVTIAADGSICYRGDFGSAGDVVAVDEFTNGVRTQTNVADDFSGEFDFLLTPRMNASRSVVINTLPLGGPTRRIVRFDPDRTGAYTRTTIAETGSVYNAFVNSTSIADSGAVAFTGRRAADSIWQVVRVENGAETVVAEGGQGDIVNSNLPNFPPVTNSNGLAAFRVEDSSTNSTSLFVGDGDTLVRVVGAGDLLDTDLGPIPAGFDFGGTTGVQTINSSIDINDENQIAFAAFLQNGTIGVFLATPADPEPDLDLNQNGEVDFKDLQLLVGSEIDFNNDALFDILDVLDWQRAAAD